jgi:two-component system CheB/CheR fusion protein
LIIKICFIRKGVFFRSLAKDKGEKSIGVILSGTGSDGTLGIKAIKEAGGLVIVEDTKSAKFDGMPRSSINTGIVDHILIADEMPNKIEHYIKYPNENETLGLDSEKSLTYLSKIFMTIRNYKNIDFSKYKESTMYRRINRRMIITKNNSIANYVDYLRSSNEEKEILFKELLIGVTEL